MRVSTSMAEGEVVLVEVEGEVDAHTARGLDKALRELLAQNHRRLLLDLSLTSFISSAGLRSIVYAHREAGQRGGQLRLCGLNVHVRRVFEMAGLDDCLHLSTTCRDALEDW